MWANLPDKNHIREERFILFMVPEASVHRGQEDMAKQLSSWWLGSQGESQQKKVKSNV